MEKLLKLCGNAMAAFMDFGVGVLIAALMALAFKVELPFWGYLIGGVLGFLPDFDIIWPILSKDRPQGDHHQTLMHRPIIILPVVAIIGWLLGGTFWSATATACVFWHYLHDTPEFGGGGVAWFWPFSRKYWSIFHGGISPKKSIMAKSETDHGRWLEENWLAPSNLAYREIGVGAWSVGIAVTISQWSQMQWWSLLYGIAALYAIWIPVLALWVIQKRRRPH